MGVKDIRISTTFLDHPKTVMLKAELGWQGIEALMRLWFFAAEYHTSGLINKTNKYIAIACKWDVEDADRFIAVLLGIKFIEKKRRGYYIHGWHVHNEWASKFEERSAKSRNANEAKKTKGYEGKTPVPKGDLRKPKKLTEDVLEQDSGTPPFPSLPSPSLPLKNKGIEVADLLLFVGNVLSHLNRLTGKSFKVNSTLNQKNIKSCLNWVSKTPEYKADPLQAFYYVINVMVAKWGGNSDMKDNLNPTCLFRLSNFEKYLSYSDDGVKQAQRTNRSKDFEKMINALPVMYIADGKFILKTDAEDIIRSKDKDAIKKMWKDIDAWRRLTPDGREEQELNLRNNNISRVGDIVKTITV